MAREYLVPAWTNAAEDHDLWSGKSPDDRKRKSHMLSPNRANTDAYSDDSIAQLKAQKKTSIPLKDRILPQSRRVQTLTNQMIELCNEYKAGLHTKEDYSLLLSVISSKRARAEQLLAKAVNVKAPFEEEEIEQAPSHAFFPNAAAQPEFMQEKKENSVKKACTSAVKDCIILLTGSATLLMGLKFLF